MMQVRLQVKSAKSSKVSMIDDNDGDDYDDGNEYDGYTTQLFSRQFQISNKMSTIRDPADF